MSRVVIGVVDNGSVFSFLPVLGCFPVRMVPAIMSNALVCLESSTSYYRLHLRSHGQDVWLLMTTVDGSGVSNGVFASFRRESHWANCSLSGWPGYAMDVSSTHYPSRTRFISSLASVMLTVKSCMIVLPWLFMGGTIPTSMLCWWKRVGMRLVVRMCILWSTLLGEFAAFCCSIMVC